MRRSMMVCLASCAVLVAGCGSTGSTVRAAAAKPPPAEPTSTPTASTASAPPAAPTGRFLGAKPELAALFARLRAVGAVRIDVHSSQPKTAAQREDIVVRLGSPIRWRERTYNPKLSDDTIRDGPDLIDNTMTTCPPPPKHMTGWYRMTGMGATVKQDPARRAQLAAGLLPYPLDALQYATFTARSAMKEGFVMKGTVAPSEALGAFGYLQSTLSGHGTPVPIQLTLDPNGLPVSLTVDFAKSAAPSSRWSATFTYSAVPNIPTIANPKRYKQTDSLDACDSYR